MIRWLGGYRCFDQDVRDLRRLVTYLTRSSQSYDNPSSAVVPRPEMDQMRQAPDGMGVVARFFGYLI